MRHQAGTFRERLHRSERFRQCEDSQILEHDPRLLPSADAEEGDHRTVSVLLTGGDLVLGVGFESRIDHPGNALVTLQKQSDRIGITSRGGMGEIRE